MAKDQPQAGHDALVDYLDKAAQERALEVEHLQQLRRALLDTQELNLELHREMLGAIAALRRELERMKRTLRHLAHARA